MSTFPLLPDDPPIRGRVRPSRNSRRRAIVLGAVHVAILAHVTHWLLAKRTISPVEPSESMRTLELGELNAGFIFFVLAIASTAVFGRFFCGWGCHVVALQDLCAWMMKKAGVKPRPFRSRLLLWAPAALAFYMFAWPTVKRIAAPIVGISAAPFPGFSNHLTTTSFWATFPGVLVAVPFLLTCGFCVVLLLGSKGFCTYGCPYGGIFAPLDRFARGRIRVSDACNGCGHCTATCTSNVRVHEEVRVFKMVVDPGCMKCMDCVSVCPNDALSYGFAGPTRADAMARAAAAGPAPSKARRWDLSWKGEVAVAAGFTAAFFAFRGIYGVVPLLMAVGMALCAMFLGWTTWRMLRDVDVSVQSVRLKERGRWRAPGIVAAMLGAAAVVAVAHSGAVQLARAAGDALDRRVTMPTEEVLAGNAAPPGTPMRAAAERALAMLRRADDLRHGGWGFSATPEVAVRRAWLALVAGDAPEARAQLSRVIARDPTNASLHRGLAAAYLQEGRTDDAIAELVIATNLNPQDLEGVRLLEMLRR